MLFSPSTGTKTFASSLYAKPTKKTPFYFAFHHHLPSNSILLQPTNIPKRLTSKALPQTNRFLRQTKAQIPSPPVSSHNSPNFASFWLEMEKSRGKKHEVGHFPPNGQLGNNLDFPSIIEIFVFFFKYNILNNNSVRI